jgi:hypothetical protein
MRRRCSGSLIDETSGGIVRVACGFGVCLGAAVMCNL